MPKRRLEAPIGKIEQDFLDALQRLLNNEPTHPRLVRLAKIGKLKINFTIVSLEAGHSRTLIAHEKCRYPRVRARILDSVGDRAQGPTAQTVILRLREENAALRARLKLRDSENAAILLRMKALEHDARRQIRAVERSAKRQTREHEVIGRRLTESTNAGRVVELAPLRNEKDRTK